MAHLVSYPYTVEARMCMKAAVRGRVLLVTKTDEHLADVREILLHKRYAVTTAQGLEAISRQAVSRAIDVVVLDLSDAVEAGLSLCRALRLEGVSVPILMLHPKGTIDDLLEGFDAGADVYLRGPHAQEDVLTQISLLCREETNSRWKRLFSL